TVALDVGARQVVEQSAATSHEQQQSAAAVVVVLVLLEVLGEVGDAVAQQSDLHLGAAGVAVSRGVLTDDLLLCGSVHWVFPIPMRTQDMAIHRASVQWPFLQCSGWGGH